MKRRYCLAGKAGGISAEELEVHLVQQRLIAIVRGIALQHHQLVGLPSFSLKGPVPLGFCHH